MAKAIKNFFTTMGCDIASKRLPTIDHLHYDVIRAKPDGSCSRPAETGPSFPGGKASARVVLKRCRI